MPRMTKRMTKKKGTVQSCLCAIRTKTGITQEELAKKVGVSRQTIIAIEKGNYVPSVFVAMNIAKCLKKPVEEIFSCTKR